MRILLLILLFNLNCFKTARILVVVPVPSISHQIVFRPITQELAKRGHDVVVITTDPAFPKGKAPDNLTEIDLNKPSYNAKQLEFAKSVKGNADDIYNQVRLFFQLFRKIFKVQLQTTEIKSLIDDRTQKFDLVIAEGCVRPAYVFSHIFKAPLIIVSTLGTFDMFNEIAGSAMHPLIYPSIFHQKINNLNVWQKFDELYKHYVLEDAVRDEEIFDNAMLKEVLGDNIPDLSDIKKRVDMLFVNVYPIWENNRPVPPNVVYIGGIHTSKPNEELPKDLRKYLDSSKNGVIYMSLGSNVVPSLLPNRTIQIFLNVFSRLSYDVLFKWDKDELSGCPKNVKIFKWLPQIDLLKHPKINLFITQGGLQSSDEAISAGVPLIGLPMLGDQWYNAENYEKHKIGLNLEIETLTEDKLLNAINTILEDKSYRRNVKNLRTLMQDQPQSPLGRAVWWIEHVIRHKGGKHLRASGANISWREYLELDLILILLFGFLSTTAAIVVSTKFIYYSLFKKK